MFQEGDSVYIKDSAQEDVGGYAWNYVQAHREAAIVCRLALPQQGVPENETLYVVVWPDQFQGGWDCYNNCIPGYGQIVAQKNMELNFEASREVVTIPNIKVPDHE